MNLALTDNAIIRISEICSEGEFLRILLIGGGCHGFSYKFEVSNNFNESEDFIIKSESGKVLCAMKKSFLEKLSEVSLDFKKTLSASYFVLESPNFATKCGCGTSFAIV